MCVCYLPWISYPTSTVPPFSLYIRDALATKWQSELNEIKWEQS